jgi:hypothetical protein
VAVRNYKNALYIHYSNLCFNRVYRTIDIFFENNYYLHEIYAPIGKDKLGIKAGVVLSNGNTLIESQFFNDCDDNMRDMISYAFSAFQNDCYDKYVPIAKIFEFSDLMKDVLNCESSSSNIHYLDYINNDFDLMQLWLLQLFMVNRGELAQNFLSFLEQVHLKYFNNKSGNLGFNQEVNEKGVYSYA